MSLSRHDRRGGLANKCEIANGLEIYFKVENRDDDDDDDHDEQECESRFPSVSINFAELILFLSKIFALASELVSLFDGQGSF